MCPNCKRPDAWVIRKGFFARSTFAKRKVQRYLCKTCGKTFSAQTEHHTFRQRTSRLNQQVFMLLCSSVSERKVAFNVGVTPRTVN